MLFVLVDSAVSIIFNIAIVVWFAHRIVASPDKPFSVLVIIFINAFLLFVNAFSIKIFKEKYIDLRNKERKPTIGNFAQTSPIEFKENRIQNNYEESKAPAQKPAPNPKPKPPPRPETKKIEQEEDVYEQLENLETVVVYTEVEQKQPEAATYEHVNAGNEEEIYSDVVQPYGTIKMSEEDYNTVDCV